PAVTVSVPFPSALVPTPKFKALMSLIATWFGPPLLTWIFAKLLALLSTIGPRWAPTLALKIALAAPGITIVVPVCWKIPWAVTFSVASAVNCAAVMFGRMAGAFR